MISRTDEEDDALFEQLEAELEQDGTFDYYRDKQIREFQSAIQKRENLLSKLRYYDSEKGFLNELSTTDLKKSNYLIVFINPSFISCQYLQRALKVTVENSSGNYTVCLIDAIESPFLVEKLNPKTLPTMIAFSNGEKVGCKVGLDGMLENHEDISTLSSAKLGHLFESYFPLKPSEDDYESDFD